MTYRPSRSTIIKRKRAILTAGERKSAQQILRDPGVAREGDFAALPVLRRALILDVVSDYLRYKAESDDPEAKVHKEHNRQVLTERSRLLVPSEEVQILPYTERPDAGHRTSRATVGAGWRNHDTFEEVSLRAAYHDLLDPEVGYTPYAQIEMDGATLRHYNRAGQVRLERVTLLNTVSLFHGARS